MKNIFVDTSALIALCNKHDTFHHKAHSIRLKLVKDKTFFITTNAVILELCNTFSRVDLKATAVQMVTQINNSERWLCIMVDNLLMKKGFYKFKNMSDKNWSLVDCISMVVAKEHKINEVFTNDHHFEQAGFSALLMR